ncbi:MAG: pyridoxal 5'-phosphate synthase glutaminase subunit PdxT [Thermoplasmata archaeon]
MKIGILGVQGAVSEHLEITVRAMRELGIGGSMEIVKKPEQMDEISGLIIPGGESTTISTMLKQRGLKEKIRERYREGMVIMGTCAGAILLAKEVAEKNVESLGLMDISVRRNAYGRQIDSFEADVEVEGFETRFHAIFIRAPVITDCWGDARVVARVDEHIIMVEQGNALALTFHPELSGDTRIHRLFLKKLLQALNPQH